MNKCTVCGHEYDETCYPDDKHEGYSFCGRSTVLATDESLCPICNKNPRDPKSREGAGGKWCMPCQDEFDQIDWGEYYERNRE